MPTHISHDALTDFLDEYKALIHQMDQAYSQAAAANGFICNGCNESCCETRFYHHTYLEYYLIQEGILGLAAPMRDEVVAASGDVCRKAKAVEAENRSYRIMCPLNTEGMCRLYAYRPMICRMHGIAHVLNRPDGSRLNGPGCHLFELKCPNPPKVRFDRTPFYLKMAEMEKQLRLTFGLQNKIKMTIAQMILAAVDGN